MYATQFPAFGAIVVGLIQYLILSRVATAPEALIRFIPMVLSAQGAPGLLWISALAGGVARILLLGVFTFAMAQIGIAMFGRHRRPGLYEG
jgi:hypothetical protein